MASSPLTPADFHLFARADLPASDPLEYYKIVETKCRLACVGQSSKAGSARDTFSAQYLLIENLLVDLGNHQLLPSQEHYRAYLSAFASLVKAWSKLLGEEVARWEAGGEGGDAEGLGQLLMSIHIVGQWLCRELGTCCKRHVLHYPDHTATVELVLVLGLARALTIAGKLLLGPLQSGLATTSNRRAGSSSNPSASFGAVPSKRLLASACSMLLRCLTHCHNAATGKLGFPISSMGVAQTPEAVAAIVDASGAHQQQQQRHLPLWLAKGPPAPTLPPPPPPRPPPPPAPPQQQQLLRKAPLVPLPPAAGPPLVPLLLAPRVLSPPPCPTASASCQTKAYQKQWCMS